MQKKYNENIVTIEGEENWQWFLWWAANICNENKSAKELVICLSI